MKEVGESNAGLSAMSVVAALALGNGAAAGNVVANDVAVLGVKIAMRQEAGGCVTGGE